MSFNAGAIVATAGVQTKKWTKGIGVMGKSLGVLTAAVGVAAVALDKAAEKAEDWQVSLRNVNTLTDEAIVNSQEMAKSLLMLDPALGSTIELTDAMYQSFSAGAADMDEAMAVTVDSAKFAKAAVTDTATAVDVLTTAQNAYGKENMSTAEASDIFFTTIKQGKINGEQLASTIGKSIPLFSSLNIPLEELGSGMAAMTKQGVNASESTTQLNAIVNSFLKPSADMKAAMEEQGIASGSALLETEGLSGALAFLENASGGSKDELSKLLPSIEAVRGTLALTGEGGKEFANILEEMENSAGATDEAFAEQISVYDTLESAMEKVQIVVGNIANFFKQDLAQGAVTAAQGMLTFLTSASGMEIVANILGSLSGAFELLKAFIDPVVDVMKDIFLTTFTQVKDLMIEIMGPVGESTALFDILGTVSAGVTSIWRIMGVSISGLIDNIGNLIIAIKETGGTIGSFFDFLKGDKTWDEVKEQASAAGDAFKDLGTGVVDNFAAIGQTIVDEVKGFSQSAVEGSKVIESSFKTSFQSVSDGVRNNWGEMVTGQEAFIGDMLSNNQLLVDGIDQGNDETVESTKTTVQTIKELWNDAFQEVTISLGTLFQTGMDVIGFGLDSWASLSSLHFQNEQAELELAQQAEMDILQQRFDDGLITQEQFDEEKKALDEKALAESNALAKKQFKNQKALDIANVWMSAASSIAGWWKAGAALGPIAGPIFAGTMTGLTTGMATAQTALIGQQKFVPQKRAGGMAGGLVQVNEAGGEIVSLPDGSQVIPNDISRQIASASGAGAGMTINFYDTQINDDMDIELVAEEVSRMIAQKTRIAS